MTPDAVQPPPELDNQYETDRVLRSYLHRVLPDEVHAAVEPGLRAMGKLAGGELYALQQDDIGEEPTLTQWGPWGDRVDRIERRCGSELKRSLPSRVLWQQRTSRRMAPTVASTRWRSPTCSSPPRTCTGAPWP